MAGHRSVRIKTISEFHRLRNLPKPEHPLVSMINLENVAPFPQDISSLRLDFYSIALQKNFFGKFKYGQQQYDFDDGAMFFMAPNQVFQIEHNSAAQPGSSGWRWVLLIHPDFLWKTSLASKIKHYEYFNYSVNEALFLSEKEEAIVNTIAGDIRHECGVNIDKFTQNIIISHVEVLLNYCERFYHRQFITRGKASHQILDRLERLLTDYFKDNSLLMTQGLPTVKYLAEKLNLSPDYLRSLLRVLTGQNAQQHIHEKLIERAKEQLTTTDLSVSEIAYQLGFKHSQSFSKLFKLKTTLSPVAFRDSFN
jgi:AraC-like DNA-binding protein